MKMINNRRAPVCCLIAIALSIGGVWACYDDDAYLARKIPMFLTDLVL